jgi:hypothetical protein
MQPAMLEPVLHRLIPTYRGRLAHLSHPAAHEATMLLGLDEPAQVIGFAMAQPRMQAILVAKSRVATDSAVTCYEDIRPWELRDRMDEVLASNMWDCDPPRTPRDDAFVPPIGPPMYRDTVERALMTLYHNLRAYSWMNPESLGKSFFFNGHGGIWTGTHHRPARELTMSKMLDQVFRDAESNARNRAEAAQRPPWRPEEYKPQPEKPHDLRGAYLVPRRRIGRLPKRDLGSLMAADQIWPGVVVLEATVGGCRTIVTHNGFVAIETRDPQLCVRWLNRINGALLQRGLQAHVLRELDVGKFYDPGTNATSGWGGTYSPNPRQNPSQQGASAWFNEAMPEQDFLALIRAAESIAHQPVDAHLTNLLEAHTHLCGHEAAQSLLFSWAVIERWLSDSWKTYLAERGVSHTRQANLQNKDAWNAHRKLDVLEMAGVIDGPTYRRLVAVKKTRNRVMHGDEPPASVSDAKEALDMAESLVASEKLFAERQDGWWGGLV